jgi:hypothetical protein
LRESWRRLDFTRKDRRAVSCNVQVNESTVLKSKIENNSLKKEKKSICFNKNHANELGEFLLVAMCGT